MPRKTVRRLPTGVGLALLAVAPTFAQQPSTILNTYVLFGQDSVRMRTATIHDGNVGVNIGLLYLRGTITAPASDLAADLAHLDNGTACDHLFTNAQVGAAPSCARFPVNVPRPLIASLSAACGFPTPFPACNPAKPVLVDHNQVKSLPPGTYGDVVVEGGGAGPAVLKLAGDYVFCNVRVSRGGDVRFGRASTLHIAGSARVSNATFIGPDADAGTLAPPPGAIRWLIQGSQARFSRKGVVSLHACAPAAKMLIGSGTTLAGRFVARSIRLKKSTITFAPPVPGVCGDTVISPDEQCETTADCTGGTTCVDCACTGATTTTIGPTTTTTTLPPCTDDEDCGSPIGAFVCEDGHCIPACDDDDDCEGDLVCIDGHCTTSTTTTTTSTPTSTSQGSSTTTTTLKPCTTDDDCPVGVCRDGFCVPECETDDDCNGGSPTGAFICENGRCVPAGEICGDCLDNDDDGFVDFEDADCCDGQAGQLFAMDLRKGRLRQRGDQSLLRLKGTLARSGLRDQIDPPTQVVGLQIRSSVGGEILCAGIPAGNFQKVKKGFRYTRRKRPLPPEIGRNLDRIRVKVSKSGQVRFKVKGKRTLLETPAEGTLTLTVGFSTPGAGDASNVCSQAVRLFRGGKKGQLRFP